MWLERVSRSRSETASHVIRAQQILSIAGGISYTDAAKVSGRKSRGAVSNLVKRFNQEGLYAIQPRYEGGPENKCGPPERERILQEVRITPEPGMDGTANWSLKTLFKALRKAPDGLP